MNAIALTIKPLINLSDDEYYELCQLNPEIKFEQDKQGRLIIVPPTGGWTGNKNIKIAAQLENWTEADGTGLAFDSNTEFILPGGGKRSPNAAWIKLDRWNALTQEQQEKFPPLCPDFVIELRSPSDTLKAVQDKMQEYIDSGARLGWLINPKQQQVEIYRQGQDEEILHSPTTLSGEDVLPGFVLNLKNIL